MAGCDRPPGSGGADTCGRAGSGGRTFPRAYLQFLELFNQQRFWEAHEVLEGPWRVNRSPFYKGLIIYASAFVHVQRGNPIGVANQMAKVLHYLPPYRPHYLGLDVDAILEDARQCRQQVLAEEAALLTDPQRVRECIAFPRLRLEPGHCRGDEPELTG